MPDRNIIGKVRALAAVSGVFSLMDLEKAIPTAEKSTLPKMIGSIESTMTPGPSEDAMRE